MSSAVDDDQDDIEANGTDDCTDEELTHVTAASRGSSEDCQIIVSTPGDVVYTTRY